MILLKIKNRVETVLRKLGLRATLIATVLLLLSSYLPTKIVRFNFTSKFLVDHTEAVFNREHNIIVTNSNHTFHLRAKM